MASYFSDNDDLGFYFDQGIDWSSLTFVTEYGYRTEDGFKTPAEAKELYRDVTSHVGELVAQEIAPRVAQIDREGARLEGGEAVTGPAMNAVFSSIKQAELQKLCLPRELGGLNAPLMLYFITGEIIARADVSVMAHCSFHGGIAMAMLALSVHEGTTSFDSSRGRVEKTRFADEIAEIARGDAWGCMDITEPDAGSDMAALRARAEQDEAGRWYITGQKIFITSGHGKYHFVIARTEEVKNPSDPMSGLSGLSMFLVKTYDDEPDGTRRRYVTIERVEEKLGHHGSVTASLSFDRAPAELVGRRGEGFQYMLVLMNNARIGVGFESLGLCEAACRMARAYAEGRRSMGKPIAKHEMIADYLDEMRTDVQALRALAVSAAFHEEMAMKLSMLELFIGSPTDQERARIASDMPRHRAASRRLTPLLKYFAAEKAVEIARRNLQIHGGVGYTKDYGAEKLLRDAIVMPIYEGTSQIQALMAMRDTLMGVLKRPQAFVAKLGQARWQSVSARDPLEKRVARVQSLSLAAQQFLVTRTAAGKLRQLADVPVIKWRDALTKQWDPKRDFALAMLHAERLTRLLVDEAVCEILLEQAKAYPERREVLERWLDRAEPRSRALYDEITTTGERLLAQMAAGEGRDAGPAVSPAAMAAE
jgi:alkylation response protein AidB-like acyl-CoA dehydrogenase